MIIECPNCSKKFNLDEKLIPKNGRTLKCSSCSHIWLQKVTLNIDNTNNKVSEDINTKSDIKSTQTDEKDNKVNKKNKVKDVLDISKESISENKTEVSKVEKLASAKKAMLFSRTNTLLSIPMLYSMVAAQNLNLY